MNTKPLLENIEKQNVIKGYLEYKLKQQKELIKLLNKRLKEIK